jgi:heat shock protein HtpX
MNGMKTAMLLAVLGALFVLIGGALGGEQGIILSLGFAVVMNVGVYWFSDRIVLRMHRAQEVGPDHPLHGVTARLAKKAGLPVPKVYVIPNDSPNAFATGRNPQNAAVAATEGLMRLLSDSELEGVIAHELAHVKHRDILISTIAATIAAAIFSLVRIAQFSAFFGGRDGDRGGNPIMLLASIILAPIAAMLIQAAISRQREFAADRGGAEIVGSPMGLASALRRIEAGVRQIPMDANPATAHMYIMKPFFGGGILSLFSTHPPTEQRVAALMQYRMGRV